MPPPAGRSVVTVTEPESLERLHDLLTSVWGDEPTVDATDRAALETALAELVANAVEHAGPSSPVPLEIVVRVLEDRLEATLVDSGVALPQQALDLLVADPPPEVDPLAESGRGLLLVRLTTDEVRYERRDGRNHWWVTRTRR